MEQREVGSSHSVINNHLETSVAILYRNDLFLQLHLRIQRRISVPESLEMSSPAARQTRKSENSVRESKTEKKKERE